VLTYELNPQAKNSLYEQIYSCIKTDIEQGVLTAGTKLPSKRQLAQHLGVSVITIENAYRQLAAEGYIETKERRGNFVNELPALSRLYARKATNGAQVGAGAASGGGTGTGVATGINANSGTGAGTSAVQQCNNPTPSASEETLLADFSGAHNSGQFFPYHVWAKNVRRTLSEASKGLLLKRSWDNCGSEELRQAIAKHLNSFRGLSVSAEQLIIGAGAQDLYDVLVQLLGRNRTFAVENPGYPALRTHYELNGAHVVSIGVDTEGMSVSQLKHSGASVAHCTPAHQFPTGVVMSAARRNELLDWALQGTTQAQTQKRYIIEDDYDSEFRMRGRPIPPLYTRDTHECVIYMNTFTRSLGSVFRIAYMVLPQHLMPQMRTTFAARSCRVGALEQLELANFISSGDYERHINRQRTAYRRLQDALIGQLSESPVGKFLTFREVDSGLHFLMDIRVSGSKTKISAQAIEQAAKARGIRLVNLSKFHSEQDICEENAAECITYVMNLSGLDNTQANTIAAALSETLQEKLLTED
jgi:GntR family transcriptional regulator/MocR family aminotransferase